MAAWVVQGYDATQGDLMWVLVQSTTFDYDPRALKSRHFNSLWPSSWPTPFWFFNGRRTDLRLLDPLTGHQFSLTDPKCPLEKVYCAFNSINVGFFNLFSPYFSGFYDSLRFHSKVWANIQGSTTSLSQLSFDFDNSSCWSPFFGTSGHLREAPTQSVQVILAFCPCVICLHAS